MQIFRYRGRKHGQVVAGQLEGVSPEAAAVHLLGLGITPIN